MRLCCEGCCFDCVVGVELVLGFDCWYYYFVVLFVWSVDWFVVVFDCGGVCWYVFVLEGLGLVLFLVDVVV